MGYLNNITSDRRLIAYCNESLAIRLYLRYNIDESLPWHSTISRTRQLYSEEVFRSLFKKILQMCVAKGMVSGRRQAMDSAFIKVSASSEHHDLYMKNHEKRTQNERYTTRMYRLRSATVEPVPRTLLNFPGMKRVNMKGIDGAEKHVLMASMCYNRQKLLKFSRLNSVLIAIGMQANIENFIYKFFSMFFSCFRSFSAEISHCFSGLKITAQNMFSLKQADLSFDFCYFAENITPARKMAVVQQARLLAAGTGNIFVLLFLYLYK